jgi:glutathione synthase
MASLQLTLAFVMDPLDGIDIAGDTTFALMLEAQRRNHEVLYVDPSDLVASNRGPSAHARPAELRRERGRHFDLGEVRMVSLDEEVDLVFQRVDPPVDAEYVVATQILSLCTRALVLNRPEGVLAANEKLYTLRFPELMAETLVSRRIPELLGFMDEHGGEMIVKPLDGKGGEGIFHLRREDRNLTSILEQSTHFESRRIMAQRYLPAVREGDKRILLLDGEPIGAVLRIPGATEVRSNLHVGGRPHRAELDDSDRKIIGTIAPSLRRDGLFFVGIDVIGGFLTEVNVTSPTGVQEINSLENRCLEAEILDAAEARLRDR